MAAAHVAPMCVYLCVLLLRGSKQCNRVCTLWEAKPLRHSRTWWCIFFSKLAVSMYVCVCVFVYVCVQCFDKSVLLSVWTDEWRLRAALPQLQASSQGSSLLADPHLLVVWPWFSLHVSVVVLETVVLYIWQTQQRPEGCEDLFQHLQQSLLPAGGDVVLGQLQEGKAVLTLTPHVKTVGTARTQHVEGDARLCVKVQPPLVVLLGEDEVERVTGTPLLRRLHQMLELHPA